MNFRHKVKLAGGYALLDLLATLVVISVVFSFFCSWINRARQKADYLICLSNSKKLIGAWGMYQADNQTKLIESYHGGDAVGGAISKDPNKSPWATGWLDWRFGPDNTNTALVVSDRYSKLARYFGNDPKVVKCPADTYLSSAQRFQGWKERVRSYSGNLGIGGGNAESGPWSLIYLHAKKIDEIPDPLNTWVFLDESPDSVNDPGFFNPPGWAFIDQPASYHEGGAGVAFADGHSEIHKWKSSLSREPATQIKFFEGLTAVVRSGDEDVAWLSSRGGLRNPNVWVGAPLGK